MLDATLKSQLQAYLEKLVYPITLTHYLDDSSQSQELKTLLNDVASVSNKITLKQGANASKRTPSFDITRDQSDVGISFAAIPMGHEFTSLVLALLHVGGHTIKLEEDVQTQIKQLNGEFNFEVYMSLSCQNCPDVVQGLNMMSVINPKIKVTTIDGGLFQKEIEERSIMAVPTVYLNGEILFQGRSTVPEMLALLDTDAGSAIAEKLNQKETFDVLIVGGGPAGAAAAVYAARKGIKTGILAERFGGQTMDTLAIENYVSVLETEGPKFAADLERHAQAYNVDIMNQQRVESLKQHGQTWQLHLANGATLSSKTVILATGARWREMNIPGEQTYRNKGVAYCPHCDGPLFKGKNVAVIGGGNSGVEAAIDLAGLVNHVTLIEFASELKADQVLQNKLHSLSNVSVIKNAQTTEVHGDGNKVTGLSYLDRSTKTPQTINLDGIFVQIGLVPNTEWLKGIVNLSKYGEIEVDAKGQTSLPGVFAAGDATTVPYKQIIIAAGDGAKASLAAFDYLIRLSPD